MKALTILIILAATLIGCRPCKELVKEVVKHDTTIITKEVIKYDTIVELEFWTDTVIQWKEKLIKVYVSNGQPVIAADTVKIFGFGNFSAYISGNKLIGKLEPADTTLVKLITLVEYRQLIDRQTTTDTTTVQEEVRNSKFANFTIWFFWLVVSFICGLVWYRYWRK